MTFTLKWIRLILNFCVFICFCTAAINYKLSIYLFYQARGQFDILTKAQTFDDFKNENKLSVQESENMLLIEQIKQFSIDSLDYLSTSNFTHIYNQKKSPILWVITASEQYKLKPFFWKFPIIGQVSYKGFFKKDFAIKEYNHLIANGYDVDLRSVTAWSTLGWFSDPVLSSMLLRSKGALCNLLFHELFHATYYASNKVDFNENIANFIAHKATQQFLKRDTLELKKYLENFKDNQIFNNYMLRQADFLRTYYKQILSKPNKYILKLTAIHKIADSLEYLPFTNRNRFVNRKADILKFKNAYFVDFQQYDSMQDSLERLFNKIYKANLKKLVQDLKQNRINY
jgi:predicted aminopeptidase